MPFCAVRKTFLKCIEILQVKVYSKQGGKKERKFYEILNKTRISNGPKA